MIQHGDREPEAARPTVAELCGTARAGIGKGQRNSLSQGTSSVSLRNRSVCRVKSEHRQQRFLGPQHSGVEYFHERRETALDASSSSARAIAAARQHPIRDSRDCSGARRPSACCSAQSQSRAPAGVVKMFDDRGSEDLKKEILVGLFVRPAPARFFLGFRARAYRDQNYAVGFGMLQRVLEPLAGELRLRQCEIESPAISKLVRPAAHRSTACHAVAYQSRAQSANSRARPSSTQPRG